MTESASYSLIPVVKEPRINPGDEIDIDLYVIGAGNVQSAQLSIVHSHTDLPSLSSGTVQSHLAPLKESEYEAEEGVLTGEKAGESAYVTEKTYIRNGCHFPIPSEFFNRFEPFPDQEFPVPFGIKYTEITHDQKPPLNYSLPTESSTRPGKYTLHFALTYQTDCGVVHQDTHKVTVELRNFFERHNKGIAIARYVAAFVALLSLLVTAYSAAIGSPIV